MINSKPFIFGTRPADLGFRELDTTPPAHERIGVLFAQIIQEKDLTRSTPHLEALGLHRDDSTGLERVHRLILQLDQPKVKVSVHSQAENAPIYKVTNSDGSTIGLFKLGRKRAAMELLARKVAFVTGLTDHTIPGVFCALGNHHHVKEWEESFEELWNGRLKIYSDLPKTPHRRADPVERAIVGILEPFDKSPKTESLEDFAKMTLLALVLGLRDAKEDGYSGSTWFDVEDVFAIRLDPREEERDPVAATDLPYLSDSKATKELDPHTISKLKALARSWDLDKIRSTLQSAFIDYADTKAEDLVFQDLNEPTDPDLFIDRSDTHPSTSTDDEGNNKIWLENPDPVHRINGLLNHWAGQKTPRLCLLPPQIETTILRITRIQEFLLAKEDSFSLLDLVYHIDPWGNTCKAYCDHLLRTPNASPKRGIDPSSPEKYIGRLSVKSLSADPEDFARWSTQTPLNQSFRRPQT